MKPTALVGTTVTEFGSARLHAKKYFPKSWSNIAF
jgi:hypothetical protein